MARRGPRAGRRLRHHGDHPAGLLAPPAARRAGLVLPAHRQAPSAAGRSNDTSPGARSGAARRGAPWLRPPWRTRSGLRAGDRRPPARSASDSHSRRNAGLRGSTTSRSQPIARSSGPVTARARSPRWLIDNDAGAGSRSTSASGTPSSAAITSIRAGATVSHADSARLAAQRPSSQSPRRFSNFRPSRIVRSRSLSQLSSPGSSCPADRPADAGHRCAPGSAGPAVDRVDQVGAKDAPGTIFLTDPILTALSTLWTASNSAASSPSFSSAPRAAPPARPRAARARPPRPRQSARRGTPSARPCGSGGRPRGEHHAGRGGAADHRRVGASSATASSPSLSFCEKTKAPP